MCRREIYNDLMTKYGAKADLMDISGQVWALRQTEGERDVYQYFNI